MHILKIWALRQWFFLFALVFVLALASYHFTTSPGFWFDEGIIAGVAKNIALYGVYGTQVAPNSFFTNNFWITNNFPVAFPVAAFFKILGVSIWTARLTPLFYLLGFVCVAYFFVKKIYGFKAAVLASLLLITFNPLYGNGKAVLGEVPGLFWLILGGLLYLYYEGNKKVPFLLAAALSWGIAVSTKAYYLVFIPSTIFLAFFLLFRKKSINYKFFFVPAVFFSLPILLWIFLAFNFNHFSFATLKNSVSYFLNSYGVSSFEPFKNLFRFVSESTPIHFTFLSIFIFAAWVIRRKKKAETLPLVYALFIFIALSFFWYLKTPGWYRYFFSIHLLVILLFPAAFNEVTGKIGIVLKKENYTRWAGTGIMASLILFQAGFLFFHYDDFYSTDVFQLKGYVEENIKLDASIFVASKPEVAFMLKNKNLYQYIFISENLKIGENVIGKVPVGYVITGSGDDPFVLKNADDIDKSYNLVYAVGHYRIYKLRAGS